MTVSPDRERITINFKKELAEKIRRKATEENRTMSNLIETAVTEYLQPRK